MESHFCSILYGLGIISRALHFYQSPLHYYWPPLHGYWPPDLPLFLSYAICSYTRIPLDVLYENSWEISGSAYVYIHFRWK